MRTFTRIPNRASFVVAAALAAILAAALMLVAATTAAWAQDDPTYPDQGEAEEFSSPEVDRLRARVSEYDNRYDRLEAEIERLRDEGASQNYEQIGALEGEQRSFRSDWGRAEEDLAEARLQAIHDAPVQGLPAQQVDQLETKRDALEASSDWTRENVGISEPVQERVREELYAVEDELQSARHEAVLQEETRRDASSRQQSSPMSAAGSGSPVAREQGSGGINAFPFALLLGVLGGSAYYAARRIGWGPGKGTKPGSGTPLASPPASPRPSAEPSASAGVEPQADPYRTRRGVPDAGPEPEDRHEPPPPRREPPIPDDDEPPPGGWGDEPEDDRSLAGGCPSCGAPVGARARFCVGCGRALGEA